MHAAVKSDMIGMERLAWEISRLIWFLRYLGWFFAVLSKTKTYDSVAHRK
jgi:hypothetical protein